MNKLLIGLAVLALLALGFAGNSLTTNDARVSSLMTMDTNDSFVQTEDPIFEEDLIDMVYFLQPQPNYGIQVRASRTVGLWFYVIKFGPWNLPAEATQYRSGWFFSAKAAADMAEWWLQFNSIPADENWEWNMILRDSLPGEPDPFLNPERNVINDCTEVYEGWVPAPCPIVDDDFCLVAQPSPYGGIQVRYSQAVGLWYYIVKNGPWNSGPETTQYVSGWFFNNVEAANMAQFWVRHLDPNWEWDLVPRGALPEEPEPFLNPKRNIPPKRKARGQ